MLAEIAADVWRAAPGRDLCSFATQLVSDRACTQESASADAGLFTHALINVKLHEVED